MDPAIVRRLVELNRTFYERFAAEFSDSRRRLHDGIEEVFRRVPAPTALVDLGCGDARVGHAWIDGGLGPAWTPACRYVGVDLAPALLAARRVAWPDGATLVPLDLTGDDWSAIPGAGTFSHAVSFSVLHHVPGRAAREDFVRGLRSVLAPGGHWAVSVWQIAGKPRFADRIRPWSAAGIDADAVDPGDLLVDWRRGGTGWRYVHHFEADDLVALLEDGGLTVDATFRSDGRSGDLGLYLVGRRP